MRGRLPRARRGQREPLRPPRAGPARRRRGGVRRVAPASATSVGLVALVDRARELALTHAPVTAAVGVGAGALVVGGLFLGLREPGPDPRPPPRRPGPGDVRVVPPAQPVPHRAAATGRPRLPRARGAAPPTGPPRAAGRAPARPGRCRAGRTGHGAGSGACSAAPAPAPAPAPGTGAGQRADRGRTVGAPRTRRSPAGPTAPTGQPSQPGPLQERSTPHQDGPRGLGDRRGPTPQTSVHGPRSGPRTLRAPAAGCAPDEPRSGAPARAVARRGDADRRPAPSAVTVTPGRAPPRSAGP